MNAILKCDKCGHVWSCACHDDPSVNACELTGDEQNCPECGSDDFTITETEYVDLYD